LTTLTSLTIFSAGSGSSPHLDRTGSTTMPAPIQFTWAKAHLSAVYDELDDGHGLRVLHRHKSRPLALVGGDDLAELLATTHPFTTRISRADDGHVAIWLEELAIYGRGGGIGEAIEDLLDEVEVYVSEWEESLRHTPDHAQRAWWVRRIELAADRAALRTLIAVTSEQEGASAGAAARAAITTASA